MGKHIQKYQTQDLLSPISKKTHYYLINSETKSNKNQLKKEAIYSVGAPTNHKELTRNRKLNKQEANTKDSYRHQES